LKATSLHDTSKFYGYKLNLSNHSYGIFPYDTPIDSLAAFSEQVHLANRMQVTFITARGNNGTSDIQYPACFDTSWVISVGGSGTTGVKTTGSRYAKGMDVIAPGDLAIVNTISSTGINNYVPFNGSSSAAPHVSGVVALLMSYMNDSISAYRNLAPEDCEFIINHSATDVGTAGYDSINGYGRLNAGKALKMVERPFNLFYHYGTNAMTPHSISKFIYNNNWDTVRLTDRYTSPGGTFYNRGKYVVKTWQVNASVTHYATQPTDSVKYCWPRHSLSNVFDLPTPSKRLDLHERAQIVSVNGIGATLKGYIYQVKDTLGNPLGWWPCDTSFLDLTNNGYSLFEYSLLTKNKAVGIHEINQNDQSVSVFPNPTNSKQTLLIKSQSESSCKIDLFDLMGRFVKTVYNGQVNAGETSISHSVDGLPNSMYIYLIKLDNSTLSTKFIKQ